VRKGSFSSWSIGLTAAVDAFKKLCLYYIRIVTSFPVARLSVSFPFFVIENVFTPHKGLPSTFISLDSVGIVLAD
jgi:hypothetical protein